MKQLIEKLKQLKFPPFFSMVALSLALFPSLFYMGYFFNRMSTLDECQEELQRLVKKSEILKAKKEGEEHFLTKLQKADHYYVDKCLESQIFLSPELKKYQAALSYDPEDLWTKRRVEFLKEGGNTLRFSEQNLKTGQGFQEVEELLQKPVEMNLDDLKKLLANIEDVKIDPYVPEPNAPSLIIKKFELTKKKLKEQEEVYLINLQLIKREIAQ